MNRIMSRFYGKYNQDHGAIAIKPAGERVDSLRILMDQEAEPDAPPRRSQKSLLHDGDRIRLRMQRVDQRAVL